MKASDVENIATLALIGVGLYFAYQIYQGISSGVNAVGNAINEGETAVGNAINQGENYISEGLSNTAQTMANFIP
jgi:hypothetical protein